MTIGESYSWRFLARVVIEAATPLAVGSGRKDVITDAFVATDANGLPYVPGTSLAGVIRHSLGEEQAKAVFGYMGGRKDGHGSNIVFSDAVMIGKDGKPLDGLQNIDFNDAFYSKFRDLPIRQHVHINHLGTTADTGKFDEQVVYQGTRFCFEVEGVAKEEGDLQPFETSLNTLFDDGLRLGSGTRNGFGKIRVVSCKTAHLDLSDRKALASYMEKDASLSVDWPGFSDGFKAGSSHPDAITYTLTLTPADYFLFGSGFGDEEADMTPVREDVITWEEGIPHFKNSCMLIPASSLKGAIAHRTAFYYNKRNNVYAEDMVTDRDRKEHTGENNKAVCTLFGSSGESDGDKSASGVSKQTRGKVLFSDIIRATGSTGTEKLFNHVAIDRFTGGAIDGALFTEKTFYGHGETYTTKLVVLKEALEDLDVEDAFEKALMDIAKGMLPLGGGVNRGNGIFRGIVKKDDKTIYPEEGENGEENRE